MLEVRDLQVNYGPIAAVKGVDLDVRAGELVSLLGANGAGKSSTLLAIAGALAGRRGRVTFEGRDVTGLSPERMVRLGIAMVPETRDVFPDLTVLDNLRLGGFVLRRDPAALREEMDRQMDLFPILAERRDQPAGTLSGGEQQQLAIARSLMSRPRLLLLDEPSLGLAPLIVERIFVLIGELRRRGLTILLVEQNAAQALAAADRAYVLSQGRIAAAGTAAEIAADTDLEAIYFGGHRHAG